MAATADTVADDNDRRRECPSTRFVMFVCSCFEGAVNFLLAVRLLENPSNSGATALLNLGGKG